VTSPNPSADGRPLKSPPRPLAFVAVPDPDPLKPPWSEEILAATNDPALKVLHKQWADLLTKFAFSGEGDVEQAVAALRAHRRVLEGLVEAGSDPSFAQRPAAQDGTDAETPDDGAARYRKLVETVVANELSAGQAAVFIALGMAGADRAFVALDQSDIAAATRLSRTTVTARIGDLSELGLVHKRGKGKALRYGFREFPKDGT